MGVVVACLMIAAPKPSDADGVEAGVTLSTRLDNGTRAGVQGPWWGIAADPELGFARALPTSNWSALLHSSFDSYAAAPQGHPATHLARFDASSAGAVPVGLWLNAFYLRSSDPLPASTSTPFASGQTQTYQGSTGLYAWRGDASYRVDGKTYQNPGLSDGRRDSLSGAVLPLRGPTDALEVRGTWRRWTLDQPSDLSAVDATLGWRRQNTEVMRSSVSAGWSESQRQDGEPTTQTFAYGGTIQGVGRQLKLPFDIRALYFRDFVSTGMVEAWRSRPGLWAALRWERTLDVEDGFFSEAALRTFGTLEFSDTLGTSMFVGVDGSIGRARPLSSTVPLVQFRRIGASLSRRLQPFVTARISYTYSWRREQHGAAWDTSFRSRAEAALTAEL